MNYSTEKTDSKFKTKISSRFVASYLITTALTIASGFGFCALVVLQFLGFSIQNIIYYCIPFIAISIISGFQNYKMLPSWAELLRRYQHLENIIQKGFSSSSISLEALNQHLASERQENINAVVTASKSAMTQIQDYITSSDEQKNKQIIETQKNIKNIESLISEFMALVKNSSNEITAKIDIQNITKTTHTPQENADLNNSDDVIFTEISPLEDDSNQLKTIEEDAVDVSNQVEDDEADFSSSIPEIYI